MAKKEVKKVAAEKKAPKPLAKLEGDAKDQYDVMKAVLNEAIEALDESKAIPAAHLRDLRKGFNVAFMASMKGRKVDPKVRKKQRLEAKLAKLKEELEALSQ
jgi:hypothetical protein